MAKGDGSGWHRESRRHAEAAKKGRPTHAKAGAKKPGRTVEGKFSDPDAAWDRFVNYGNDPMNHTMLSPSGFLQHYHPGMTNRQAIDAELVDISRRENIDFSKSNIREMLVKYLDTEVGTDRYQELLRDPLFVGNGHEAQTLSDWNNIVRERSKYNTPADYYPTEAEAIGYIKARTFEPEVAQTLYRKGITPEQAAIVTEVGIGGYRDTIGYKVSNGDLSYPEAKEIARRNGARARGT
jgi:hypothetical protein